MDYLRNKANIKNIKSNYILKKIFNNLEEKKSLKVIKINNNIKKNLNININNYKEYSAKYSSIEIEIKIVNNEYGKFINIEKEDEIYYHIYFNNKKEEIKRNYIKKGEKVENIKILINCQIKSLKDLFKYCSCIESINFKKLSWSNNIDDISYMFYGCSSLKELNLNNFYFNNVTNINGMFWGCLSLKELNLNNFITNNVTSMSCMFYGCSSLKELNLNNFNTNNVTNMGYMFSGCSSLKELNLNNFNTNNVGNMNGMFYECSNELIMKIKNKYKNIREEAYY